MAGASGHRTICGGLFSGSFDKDVWRPMRNAGSWQWFAIVHQPREQGSYWVND